MTGTPRKPAAEGLYWLLFQASDEEAEEVTADLLTQPNVTWNGFVTKNLGKYLKTKAN